MQNEYWQQRWESNEIAFNQADPNRLLVEFIDKLGLKTGDKILVPLCGKSIDMRWLASQGYKVLGVELSEIACQDFFAENDIPFILLQDENYKIYQSESITLLCGDFFKLNKAYLNDVAAVYDRAALIALPAAMRQRYAQALIDLVPAYSKYLLVVMTYDQNKMGGPPFSMNEAEINQLLSHEYRIEKIYDELAQAIPSHLQAKGLTEACDQVYYLHKDTAKLSRSIK